MVIDFFLQCRIKDFLQNWRWNEAVLGRLLGSSNDNLLIGTKRKETRNSVGGCKRVSDLELCLPDPQVEFSPGFPGECLAGECTLGSKGVP